MTGLLLLGIPCSGYTVLPQLQRATPPHARTAVISSHFNSWADFSGESLESQIRGNWDQADTLVAAANAREDFGGVVGGSYLVMYGLLLTAAVAVCFLIAKDRLPLEPSIMQGPSDPASCLAPCQCACASPALRTAATSLRRAQCSA